MLRLIFTKNTIIRDVCMASLSLTRSSADISSEFIIYQKGDWILIYSREYDIDVLLSVILDNYDPDRIYLPYLGRSIDMMHEIGDVILPNVFMTYSMLNNVSESPRENLEIPTTQAKFLEIYEEQKDYYIEDYGLSMGGIVVDNTPHDNEINTELMMTYEADIYTMDSLSPAYTVTSGDLVPALILCGITEGKANQNMSGTPEQMAIRNILTTIRLIEADDEIQ